MSNEDKKIKIVFFGTPEFAVASLDRLLKDGWDVAAVVTMPDKIAGRGHKLIESDVKKYAVEHGLRVLQPEKLKAPEFVDELRSIGADLFIVIAFRMLPEVVWGMPRLGTFNLHASLLPRYRGAAPLNWAVINGDTETGVTTFFLKHEIDTGDIIEQRKVEILPTDNVGDVHDRLMELGADMVAHTVSDIAAGNVTPQPQPEGEFIPAPKIFKETCRIDWAQSAVKIHNLIRGLSPYPAAWCEMEEIRSRGKYSDVKIYQSALVSDMPEDSLKFDNDLKPGEVY
ncbi:MAG: methionyl-tRNA formyltransferase, partial [Muribaculaceae bacterium]|nr:methionyl-tRNA formyltransferase [Muribaculaceae bacterium]